MLTIRPVGHKEAVYNLRYFITKLCQEYPGNEEYFEIEDELQFVLEKQQFSGGNEVRNGNF